MPRARRSRFASPRAPPPATIKPTSEGTSAKHTRIISNRRIMRLAALGEASARPVLRRRRIVQHRRLRGELTDGPATAPPPPTKPPLTFRPPRPPSSHRTRGASAARQGDPAGGRRTQAAERATASQREPQSGSLRPWVAKSCRLPSRALAPLRDRGPRPLALVTALRQARAWLGHTYAPFGEPALLTAVEATVHETLAPSLAVPLSSAGDRPGSAPRRSDAACLKAHTGWWPLAVALAFPLSSLPVREVSRCQET